MKAKDIMEPLDLYLYPTDTVRTAIHKMTGPPRPGEKAGVKGLTVLDENKKLVGMLDMLDILKALMPFYMDLSNLSEFAWDGMLERLAERIADKKVSDIMDHVLVTVESEASLMKCAESISKNDLQRLPVVDKEGRVVGIIYLRDLYRIIVKSMVEKNNEEK